MESYYTKDGRGLTLHGNNDSTDVVTAQLVPYLTLRFPFGIGSTFEEINRKGLNFGQDLDGDGTNEKADLVSIVTVKGFENVTVPAGTFSNCARVETQATVTVIMSSNGAKVTKEPTQTMWFAPGRWAGQIGCPNWQPDPDRGIDFVHEVIPASLRYETGCIFSFQYREKQWKH